MVDVSPAAIASGVINRALESEAWARERLAAHAGSRFTIVSGPFSTPFSIGPGGTLAAATGDVPETLTLRISPFDLPGLAAEPARWRECVHAEGDDALAATLQDLATTLPWFVERALGSTLGPVIGQQVADVGRALLAWPGEASRKFTEHAARYAGEESDLLVRRGETARTDGALSEIGARAEALAARVAALERRIAAGPRQRTA